MSESWVLLLLLQGLDDTSNTSVGGQGDDVRPTRAALYAAWPRGVVVRGLPWLEKACSCAGVDSRQHIGMGVKTSSGEDGGREAASGS